MTEPETVPGDPLAGLADIRLPPDVPLWPLAPGWIGLAGLLLLVLLVLAVREWRWRRTVAYQALCEFDTLARDPRHGDAQALAAACGGLLRRLAQMKQATAPAGAAPAGVAVMTGDAWAAYLASGKVAFEAPVASFLAWAPYLPPGTAEEMDRARMVAAVRRWIRAQA
ncbi:DUF4381 domain-containing protein [Xanthobacter sp. AM11]|uniref:DUF4381 domain-containing protein n=1 Tax=Xanthobacter sp. AM11 TaxID=3380643 RepID=UPI0039BEF797